MTGQCLWTLVSWLPALVLGTNRKNAFFIGRKNKKSFPKQPRFFLFCCHYATQGVRSCGKSEGGTFLAVCLALHKSAMFILLCVLCNLKNCLDCQMIYLLCQVCSCGFCCQAQTVYLVIRQVRGWQKCQETYIPVVYQLIWATTLSLISLQESLVTWLNADALICTATRYLGLIEMHLLV